LEHAEEFLTAPNDVARGFCGNKVEFEHTGRSLVGVAFPPNVW
jgi:hypothetical protein